MKKLLLLIPNLGQGGQERVCVETARILENEFDITIGVFDTSDVFYDLDGLDLIDINVPSKQGIVSKILNTVFRIYRVKKIIQEKEIDYIYSFGMTANLVNVFLGKRVKKIIGIRGYGSLKNKTLLKWMLRKADLCIGNSEKMKNEIEKMSSKCRVECLYNPVDCGKIEELAVKYEEDLDRFSNKRIITYIGRINDIKGIWHLIRVFAYLKKEYPDLILLILGEGLHEEYEDFAKKLKVSDSIYWLGAKENPFPYIKQSEVFVLPSLSEGFPNALVEALAVGTPVVATDCLTGPREILMDDFSQEILECCVGDYGILVPQLSNKKNLDSVVLECEEKNLFTGIQKILNSMELKQNLYKKGKMRSNFFSIEKYKCTLLDILLSE